MRLLPVFLLSANFLFAQERSWHCGLLIGSDTIRFDLFQEKNGKMLIRNGEEELSMEPVPGQTDSLELALSVFDARLIIPRNYGASFEGWYRKGDARIPSKGLKLLAGLKKKVPATGNAKIVAGTWPLEFLDGDRVQEQGILVLKQDGNRLQGSILTETGDYRFLNGEISGSSGFLQTFDGGHAYYFHLRFSEKNGALQGEFLYSQNGKMNFRGIRKDDARLASGFSGPAAPVRLRFSARDAEGKQIKEDRFRGKSLVLQIMGTWCPNCLDETRFLVEEYPMRPENVEFAALAFERKNDASYAQERISIVKRKLAVPYPVYWAGSASKDSASKALPELGGIKAFPTTVFVKSNGEILKIHSGFSGPATGEAYEEWRNEFRKLLQELVR